MSKKKYITTFSIVFLLLLLSGVVFYYFLLKDRGGDDAIMVEKSIDVLFEEMDNNNQEINKEIEDIINETDFDPEKDSPEVIVEKLNKLEKMSEDVEKKLY